MFGVCSTPRTTRVIPPSIVLRSSRLYLSRRETADLPENAKACAQEHATTPRETVSCCARGMDFGNKKLGKM